MSEQKVSLFIDVRVKTPICAFKTDLDLLARAIFGSNQPSNLIRSAEIIKGVSALESAKPSDFLELIKIGIQCINIVLKLINMNQNDHG